MRSIAALLTMLLLSARAPQTEVELSIPANSEFVRLRVAVEMDGVAIHQEKEFRVFREDAERISNLLRQVTQLGSFPAGQPVVMDRCELTALPIGHGSVSIRVLRELEPDRFGFVVTYAPWTLPPAAWTREHLAAVDLARARSGGLTLGLGLSVSGNELRDWALNWESLIPRLPRGL
ncbi:MAG: hypothetical protein QM817_25135 [Archangium sp.]